jgi:hypothetical protein
LRNIFKTQVSRLVAAIIRRQYRPGFPLLFLKTKIDDES